MRGENNYQLEDIMVSTSHQYQITLVRIEFKMLY